MDYVQITAPQRAAMLSTIGVSDVSELFSSLPPEYRLDRPLNLPAGASELEMQRELAEMGSANFAAASSVCFMGAGAYDHFIPAAVDQLGGQGEFVTAYTPYQAEASQGSLQAFFEFQTQVCRLTGLDVANASLYEGATAMAEAVMMALNVTGKRRVLMSAGTHPHYRRVMETYLADLPAQLITLPAERGVTTPAIVREHLDDDTACLLVQSPNVLGLIEDWADLFAAAHEQPGCLAIAGFNPIACGMLKSPGDAGADIAAGEGQPLGVPMQFGGPWLGLFATRQKLMRKMPGRLVGQTHDQAGKRGFCLTLQTREQHIRGAKATSNICTNQGLLALRATIYMSCMGPAGLKQVAQQCYHKAHHAAERLSVLPGYAMAYPKPFFHEFVLACPTSAADIIDAGRDRGILPGIDCSTLNIGLDNHLLVTVTEKRTADDIAALEALLRDISP